MKPGLFVCLSTVFNITLTVITQPLFADDIDIKSLQVDNEAAYIPAQCYVKSEIETNSGKKIVNPCYSCHTRSPEPNYINDEELQLNYSLPESALENPWKNLFANREEKANKISNSDIEKYIHKNNYLDKNKIVIEQKLTSALPSSWDYNDNKKWDGFIPDCYYNFDELGFDRDNNGSYTGWRAFAYYPLPAVHWPISGSFADALVRLPEEFRRDNNNNFDLQTYQTNLAIVESLIRKADVALPFVADEKKYGVDLDKDGKIDTAKKITFSWNPRKEEQMSYVGKAKEEQEKGNIQLAAGLFPVGTEFLQALRYLDTNDKGEIIPANRVKELRYMKKNLWHSYSDLENLALADIRENDDFPDRTRPLVGNPEEGIINGVGWRMQGFIEDKNGELRPQSFPEITSCIGCHGGVGATTDSVFSFGRKLNDKNIANSWFHWSSRGMKGINEPKTQVRGAGTYYEYSYYLMYSGGVDDYRTDNEIRNRFFTADGKVKEEMLTKLHDDISLLLYPTPEMATRLNKIYKTIVNDQSYIDGKTPVLSSVKDTVHETVEADLPTGVKKPTSTAIIGGRFGGFKAALKQERATLSSQTKEILKELAGEGMAGPDGKVYEVDSNGLIYKSSYSGPSGIYFPFPERHTLPTRYIAPLAKTRICYTCHRLPYPSGPVPESVDVFTMQADSKDLANKQQLTHNPARDLNGRWSPDGNKIVFVSNRSGSDQLWLMDADGSNKKQLTFVQGQAAWPEWNKDGTKIVFWSYDDENSVYAIKMLEFRDNGENTVKELVKSKEILNRPVFQPQGRYIAYSGQTEGNWDIWLYDLSTKEKIRLTTHSDMETNPLWRPDGEALAYKVAPAGKYSLTEEYFMTFANGYKKPEIYKWEGPQSAQMTDWSPDGKSIAYTAELITDASGRDKVSYSALVSDVVLEDGIAKAENTVITSQKETLGDRGAVFSPDGKKVAFWAWNTDGKTGIWVYDREKDQVSKLANSSADIYPRWSPDGKSLLFTSMVNHNLELLTRKLDD